MASLLWLCLGLVAFSYLGYFLVLLVWDGVRDALSALRFVAGGEDRRARREADAWPRVSIVFSAFDEETVIRHKIENCLALDYPPDRLEIVVGCDGCTDRTAEIARAAGGDRVTVHELTPRAGKSAAISKLVPGARGDLVVLTDANVMLEPGALRALVRRFRDPAVGAVVGRLRLYNPTRAEFEESLYWKYETVLKYYEGKHGAVLGANGGLYAIRRILFSPIRPDTIVEDFVIPVRIAVRGWKVPYEPDAVAHEETTEDAGREFVRRARIGAGDWQALARVPDLLDPRTGFLFFSFVSHKLLRWTTPFLLALALVLSVPLAAQPGAWLYRALLLGQLLFYGLALAGPRVAAGRLGRVASLAHYFVTMNAALAVGLWRFVRGTQRATWERTERVAPPPGVRAA
ncbi:MULTISPECIES: glycosyltransferase family 2 protein [Anaeromyxobacter]|uniref:glycosyltransferase family 2 protein n=1 Tax=Anaeromyxobacter TaxID=161492 RepID=UPI001F59861E|nr:MULTISPECIES: glycosyltransferase family 2 protein [unclassified Anaeromyxobacter]